MIALDDAERLYEAAKRLRDERRKAEKLSAKARAAAAGKQSQSANVDLNWAAMHIVRIEAELHAVAVDAGIADLRELEHYRPRTISPSAWHTYEWQPAVPRAFYARLGAATFSEATDEDKEVGSGSIHERPF